jgi:hypothetical protein
MAMIFLNCMCNKSSDVPFQEINSPVITDATAGMAKITEIYQIIFFFNSLNYLNFEALIRNVRVIWQ